MKRLFAREPLAPDTVVARAGLPRGAKVLAAAEARDGTWLLGTRDHLVVVPEPSAGTAVRAISWQQVEAADWKRDEDRLRISEVGEFGRARPVHEHLLDDPGQLLAFVRERVTASVVLQRRVVVRDRLGLLVVARRAPNGTGDLTWAYELDAGLDPDDPEVRAMADRGDRAAAEELGLA